MAKKKKKIEDPNLNPFSCNISYPNLQSMFLPLLLHNLPNSFGRYLVCPCWLCSEQASPLVLALEVSLLIIQLPLERVPPEQTHPFTVPHSSICGLEWRKHSVSLRQSVPWPPAQTSVALGTLALNL